MKNRTTSLSIVDLLVLLLLCGAAHAARAQYADVQPERVAAIAATLPAEPQSPIAPPCSDRAAWSAIAPQLSRDVNQANSLLGKPFPAWSDEAYLDYFKTGSRELGSKMMTARTSWLVPLVMAECAQWNGTYLKTIAMVLDELALQKSWAIQAHDVDQGYITGKRYFVELSSAALANDLATSLYLLGDKVPPLQRQHVMDALEKRVFAPMRVSYTTGKGQTWLRVTSNWNAVCLAGVTGAALTVLPSREDRAFFAAAAEYYQRFYLKSFPADGFEVEGIGYWNYGFSNYAVLREELWRATNGRIDLFSDPIAQKVAHFGTDIQMLPGVIAYFSDAHFGEEPNPWLEEYVSRIFGMPMAEDSKPHAGASMQFELMSYFQANDKISSTDSEDTSLRVFYPVAGVLVTKPADRHGIAATIKAMGNGPHSHNDIGSYAIGLGDSQPLGEAGGPTFYTAQTFSKDRFQSKLLNSYGHPVPVIDGQLQKNALTVKAPIISKEFTAQRDSVTIDMTDAYAVPALRRLTRTLTHDRTGRGTVLLRDEYSVASPLEVDEALITVGEFKQIDDHTLLFTQNGSSVTVHLHASEPFTVRSERIDEYGRPFTRIGLSVKMKDGDVFEFEMTPSDK